MPFFSHGIYQEQPTRFDRYLFALQFSPDWGISPRISPYSVCELLLIGGREREKKRADGNSSFQGFDLSRRSLVNRAFQSHFQEKLWADRAVQPAGAEDGSPGEGLLVPQDDGVGQGRGWVTSSTMGCYNLGSNTENYGYFTRQVFPRRPGPCAPSLRFILAFSKPHLVRVSAKKPECCACFLCHEVEVRLHK